jgi:hypothetical protein
MVTVHERGESMPHESRARTAKARESKARPQKRRAGQQTFEFRTWGGKRKGAGRKQVNERLLAVGPKCETPPEQEAGFVRARLRSVA